MKGFTALIFQRRIGSKGKPVLDAVSSLHTLQSAKNLRVEKFFYTWAQGEQNLIVELKLRAAFNRK